MTEPAPRRLTSYHGRRQVQLSFKMARFQGSPVGVADKYSAICCALVLEHCNGRVAVQQRVQGPPVSGAQQAMSRRLAASRRRTLHILYARWLEYASNSSAARVRGCSKRGGAGLPAAGSLHQQHLPALQASWVDGSNQAMSFTYDLGSYQKQTELAWLR